MADDKNSWNVLFTTVIRGKVKYQLSSVLNFEQYVIFPQTLFFAEHWVLSMPTLLTIRLKLCCTHTAPSGGHLPRLVPGTQRSTNWLFSFTKWDATIGIICFYLPFPSKVHEALLFNNIFVTPGLYYTCSYLTFPFLFFSDSSKFLAELLAQASCPPAFATDYFIVMMAGWVRLEVTEEHGFLRRRKHGVTPNLPHGAFQILVW